MEHLLYNNGEVVGAFALSPPDRQFAETCPPNTPVTIQAEPDNPHDPYAVMVFANGIPIGYIPRDVSPMLCLFLQGGYTIEGIVEGRIGKRSRGSKPTNPAITLRASMP